MLQIGELSAQTGVPAKTIRYYEEIGLLAPTCRAENGYRLYDQAAVGRLQFIRRARGLDFSLDAIGELLTLRERGQLPCNHVLSRMEQQLAVIQARIRELEQLHAELTMLVAEGQRLPQDIRQQNCECQFILDGSVPQREEQPV